MRPIHLVRLDKTRPAVILTRERASGSMARLTVAPITTTVKGISSEVPVGRDNGLDGTGVISCDNLMTVPLDAIGRPVGFLRGSDEVALARALINAFDLRIEDL